MADNSPCYDDPREKFCLACPDHEACSQGMPKRLVMEAHNEQGK